MFRFIFIRVGGGDGLVQIHILIGFYHVCVVVVVVCEFMYLVSYELMANYYYKTSSYSSPTLPLYTILLPFSSPQSTSSTPQSPHLNPFLSTYPSSYTLSPPPFFSLQTYYYCYFITPLNIPQNDTYKTLDRSACLLRDAFSIVYQGRSAYWRIS